MYRLLKLSIVFTLGTIASPIDIDIILIYY